MLLSVGRLPLEIGKLRNLRKLERKLRRISGRLCEKLALLRRRIRTYVLAQDSMYSVTCGD